MFELEDTFFLVFADGTFEEGLDGTTYWSEPGARVAAEKLAKDTGRPVSLCVDDGDNEFEIQVFEPEQ